MKLQEILQLVETDSEISDHLGDESKKIPVLHGRYLTLRSNEAIILKQLEIQRSKLLKKRYLFYTGKAEPAEYKAENFDLKVLRSDVDIFLDSDDQLSELDAKIEMQKQKVNLLDDFIKALNQRVWAIKNALEWKKFENGVM